MIDEIGSGLHKVLWVCHTRRWIFDQTHETQVNDFYVGNVEQVVQKPEVRVGSKKIPLEFNIWYPSLRRHEFAVQRPSLEVKSSLQDSRKAFYGSHGHLRQWGIHELHPCSKETIRAQQRGSESKKKLLYLSILHQRSRRKS